MSDPGTVQILWLHKAIKEEVGYDDTYGFGYGNGTALEIIDAR
jgi:hypothetical protein